MLRVVLVVLNFYIYKSGKLLQKFNSNRFVRFIFVDLLTVGEEKQNATIRSNFNKKWSEGESN